MIESAVDALEKICATYEEIDSQGVCTAGGGPMSWGPCVPTSRSAASLAPWTTTGRAWSSPRTGSAGTCASQEFRGPVWQASNAALVELQSQLEELRSKVDIITRDIVQAG